MPASIVPALAAPGGSVLGAVPRAPGVVPSAQTTRAFLAWLLSVLPRALAVEAVVWVVCFVALTAILRGLKSHLKPNLMRLDDSVRAWAKTLRYQAAHPDASPETARRAAQIELEAQKRAEQLDRDLLEPLPEPAASTSSATASTSSTSGQAAGATVVADVRKAESNGHLWIDGNNDGLDDRDRNRDGVVSREEQIAAELDDDAAEERAPLTWFFRFWTNFASAPCLSCLSLAVPLLAAHRAGGVSSTALWISRSLPSSFWARALVANIAPPRLAFVAAAGLSAPALAAARVWAVPGLSYAGAMTLSFWLKRVFKRLRPQRNPGAFGHKLKDGSFPSGHSLTAACFWIAIAATSATSGASAFQTGAIALGGAATVAFTMLSRVYLGVHFPSDVLGGFCIGAVWCAASLPALRWALHV